MLWQIHSVFRFSFGACSAPFMHLLYATGEGVGRGRVLLLLPAAQLNRFAWFAVIFFWGNSYQNVAQFVAAKKNEGKFQTGRNWKLFSQVFLMLCPSFSNSPLLKSFFIFFSLYPFLSFNIFYSLYPSLLLHTTKTKGTSLQSQNALISLSLFLFLPRSFAHLPGLPLSYSFTYPFPALFACLL